MHKEKSFDQSAAEWEPTTLDERWLHASGNISDLISERCPAKQLLELDDPLRKRYPRVEIPQTKLVEANEKMPKWMRGPWQRLYEFGSGLMNEKVDGKSLRLAEETLKNIEKIDKLSKDPQGEAEINSLLSDFIEKRATNFLNTLEARFKANVQSIESGEKELLNSGEIEKVRTAAEIEDSLKKGHRSLRDIRSHCLTKIQNIRMAAVDGQEAGNTGLELEKMYKEVEQLRKELTGAYDEADLKNVPSKERGKITGVFPDHNLANPYHYDKRFIED